LPARRSVGNAYEVTLTGGGRSMGVGEFIVRPLCCLL